MEIVSFVSNIGNDLVLQRSCKSFIFNKRSHVMISELPRGLYQVCGTIWWSSELFMVLYYINYIKLSSNMQNLQGFCIKYTQPISDPQNVRVFFIQYTEPFASLQTLEGFRIRYSRLSGGLRNFREVRDKYAKGSEGSLNSGQFCAESTKPCSPFRNS